MAIERYHTSCSICWDKAALSSYRQNYHLYKTRWKTTDNGAVVGRNCQHVFHEACIAGWLAQNNSCPQCRLPFQGFNWFPSVDHLISYIQRMSAKVQEIFTQIFLTEVRRPPTVVTHYLSHRDEADPFRHLRLILDAETNTLLLREPTLSEALSAFVGIGPASFMMVVLYLAEHPELMSNVEKEEMNRIITIYNERHLKQVPMLG